MLLPLSSVINSVGFDAVYVQFYNNYCGVNNFNNPNDWNFGTWYVADLCLITIQLYSNHHYRDNWAKTTSPNPNVKVFIGAPASSTAANAGYVDAATLGSIVEQTRSQYSSFGGVMLWDASQAFGAFFDLHQPPY